MKRNVRFSTVRKTVYRKQYKILQKTTAKACKPLRVLSNWMPCKGHKKNLDLLDLALVMAVFGKLSFEDTAFCWKKEHVRAEPSSAQGLENFITHDCPSYSPCNVERTILCLRSLPSINFLTCKGTGHIITQFVNSKIKAETVMNFTKRIAPDCRFDKK